MRWSSYKNLTTMYCRIILQIFNRCSIDALMSLIVLVCKNDVIFTGISFNIFCSEIFKYDISELIKY